MRGICPDHFTLLDYHFNVIWRRVKVVRILIVQILSNLLLFYPLSIRIFGPAPDLTHPTTMFLP
jgi:hypothetical protein